MAKNLEFSFLLDFYGDLLTEKQREAIEYYYNQDLSLAEISQNLGITRQGVRDAIKRAETLLYEMEDSLGLAKKSLKITEGLNIILNEAQKIQKYNSRFVLSKDIQNSADLIEKTARELYK